MANGKNQRSGMKKQRALLLWNFFFVAQKIFSLCGGFRFEVGKLGKLGKVFLLVAEKEDQSKC